MFEFYLALQEIKILSIKNYVFQNVNVQLLKIDKVSTLKRLRTEKWLITYKEVLNISALEIKLGFKRGVLSKFFKEKESRKLKNDEILIIHQFIEKMLEDLYDEE